MAAGPTTSQQRRFLIHLGRLEPDESRINREDLSADYELIAPADAFAQIATPLRKLAHELRSRFEDSRSPAGIMQQIEAAKGGA